MRNCAVLRVRFVTILQRLTPVEMRSGLAWRIGGEPRLGPDAWRTKPGLSARDLGSRDEKVQMKSCQHEHTRTMGSRATYVK